MGVATEGRTEIWTSLGLTTYYALFFIHLSTRRIALGGITVSPDEAWVRQVARNVTGFDGELAACRYLIHDRDANYTAGFATVLKGAGIEPVRLPPRSPNLNAYAERFVRSIKEECLGRFVLFGERALRHVVGEYVAHYHAERNHQGIGNAIPFPDHRYGVRGPVVRSGRLGGLLNYYHRRAA